jgi:DNA-binding LytR/AlgR family response regulator
MIRAIVVDSYAKAGNTTQDFNAFQPAMEPVKDHTYPVIGKQNNVLSKAFYDRNDFILVKNEYKMINIQVKDIMYIEGKGNYVSFFTTRSKILTLQTMKNLESFLLPYQFVRVHKSFLVSFHHVEAIDNSAVWIKNIEIPIGDSYRESFREFLNTNTKQI